MNEDRGARDQETSEAGGDGRPGGGRWDGGGNGLAGGSSGYVPGGRAPGRDAPGPGAWGDGRAGGGAVPRREPGLPGSAGPDAPRGRSARRGRRRRRRTRSWWVELPILLAFALVLALLIKTFVVQAFYIPSSSMENTLEIGDKVLVNKLVYDFRPIQPGDVVVFNGEGSWDPQSPSEPGPQRLWNAIWGLFGTAPGVHDYIKRVIGVPGDHVACCDARGRVTVNGVPLNEGSYLYPGDRPSVTRFSKVVPAGQLWVMGDHRGVSYDSRGHQGDPGGGTIPESQVVGRAFVIVWPVSRWRVLPIPATFKQPGVALGASGATPYAAGVTSAAAGTLSPAAGAAPLAPLALGFTFALPMTWLQRRWRLRLSRAVRSRASTWLAGRRSLARRARRPGRR